MENQSKKTEQKGMFNSVDAIRAALHSSISEWEKHEDNLLEDEHLNETQKELLEKQKEVYNKLSKHQGTFVSIEERVAKFFRDNVSANTFHSDGDSFNILEVENEANFKENMTRMIEDIKLGL